MGVFWRFGLERGPNYRVDLLHGGEEKTPCVERVLRGGEAFDIETGDTDTRTIGRWALEKFENSEGGRPVGKANFHGEAPKGFCELGSELDWSGAYYAGRDVPAISISNARPMLSAEVGIEPIEGVPGVHCIPESVQGWGGRELEKWRKSKGVAKSGWLHWDPPDDGLVLERIRGGVDQES